MGAIKDVEKKKDPCEDEYMESEYVYNLYQITYKCNFNYVKASGNRNKAPYKTWCLERVSLDLHIYLILYCDMR